MENNEKFIKAIITVDENSEFPVTEKDMQKAKDFIHNIMNKDISDYIDKQNKK